MIDYITGKITELSPTRVTVDNNGIGYCLEISLQTYSSLEGKTDATIYIQSQVNQREGTSVEYGFFSKSEREIFRQITAVSGIGSSSARMILSSLSTDELREAIISENINTIKSVKGIGLKSAQRIILELKDRIVKTNDPDQSSILFQSTNTIIDEATSALLMLGFNKQNISKAIQSILKQKPSAKVEELIKAALQLL